MEDGTAKEIMSKTGREQQDIISKEDSEKTTDTQETITAESPLLTNGSTAYYEQCNNMEEYIQLISNVGFPIAMTFYLIFKFEKTLKANTDSITELTKYLRDKK